MIQAYGTDVCEAEVQIWKGLMEARRDTPQIDEVATVPLRKAPSLSI